jgi:hypothetical protein
MTALEIILVIAGFILFIGSFFITEKITASSEQIKAAIDVNEVKKLIQNQIGNMNDEIEEAITKSIESSTDGVQRSMEKLSNEKIMAINEYSDTVMDSINKNHNEVMFLYGMLNDKNKEIKDTADLITKANKGITKKMNEAQLIVDKMDKQIVELNKYNANQQESMEKLSKSASTIEILEEQINNIEQMALQFSRDIKSEDIDAKKRNVEIQNDEYINEEDSSEENFDFSIFGEIEEDDLENQPTFKDIEELNREEEIEEIFGNFSNEKVNDYNQGEEVTNNNSKILSMSKEGQSALDIAKALGLGVGEVQLVIDLFEGGRR